MKFDKRLLLPVCIMVKILKKKKSGLDVGRLLSFVGFAWNFSRHRPGGPQEGHLETEVAGG